MVFGDRLDLSEYRIDDAGRHNDTSLVVKEYVVIPGAFVGSSDLAHSVEWPGYISQIPVALDIAMFATEECGTLAVPLYSLSSCASELLATSVWSDDDSTRHH